MSDKKGLYMILDEAVSIAKGFYKIFERIKRKFKRSERERERSMKVGRYEQPISRVRMYTSTDWSILLLREMIIRSNGSILNELTCKFLELEEKGEDKTDEGIKLRKILEGHVEKCIYKWELIQVRNEAILLISEIVEKIETEERKKYFEDEEDPPVEIWKWVLVFLWWRIIFEYKMFKLDEEEKLKVEAKKRITEISPIPQEEAPDLKTEREEPKKKPIHFEFKKSAYQ